MNQSLLSKSVFVMLLAVVVNVFIYFGFANITSAPLFNEKAFLNQYQSGVYQYRYFGSYLLIKIYHLIAQLPFSIRMQLTLLDAKAEANFFFSYFVLNTFFLMLSNLVLLGITQLKTFVVSQAEQIMLVTCATFLIGISQFVIVPYDCSGYFFFFCFVWLLIKYLEDSSVLKLILIIFLIALSTINRESSALSLSFAGVVLYRKFGLKLNTIKLMSLLTFVFLLTYVGVRFCSGEFILNNDNYLYDNFTMTRNYLAMLFWLVFFWFTLFVAIDSETRGNIWLFHGLSAPYILMCFYTGAIYEVRLYIPVFLGALVLSRLMINQKSFS